MDRGELRGVDYSQPLIWVAHTSYYKKMAPVDRTKSISPRGIASSSNTIGYRSILFEEEGVVPRRTVG